MAEFLVTEENCLPSGLKNQYTIIEKCTHYVDDEGELTILGHRLSENLPIAEDACSPKHTEGDDGEVDHALEDALAQGPLVPVHRSVSRLGNISVSLAVFLI